MKLIRNYIATSILKELCDAYNSARTMSQVITPVKHPRVHLLFPESTGDSPFYAAECHEDQTYDLDFYFERGTSLMGGYVLPTAPSAAKMIGGSEVLAYPGDVLLLEDQEIRTGWFVLKAGQAIFLFRR